LAENILFKFTADAEFYAEDIDDAMILLSDHFRAMSEGWEDEKDKFQLAGGRIDLRPCEGK
jgi:hypothetical protein